MISILRIINLDAAPTSAVPHPATCSAVTAAVHTTEESI